MKSETGWVYTQSDLDARDANLIHQTKDFLVEYLEENGLMSDGVKWGETHAIVIVRKGLFGRLIDKALGLKGDSQQFQVMELKPNK